MDKFPKYLTASSYSTYVHEKGSVFPVILPKLTNFKLGMKKFLPFLVIPSFTKSYYYRKVYLQQLLL